MEVMVALTTFPGNADLVRRFVDAQVEFLIIGGLAVLFYKCRDRQKVDDLDLLLNPSVENVERFVSVLSSPNLMNSYNLKPLHLPSVQQVARPNVHIPLKIEPMFYMDVLTPQEDVNFGELFSRSEYVLLNNSIPVRVISRPDLAEMKRRSLQTLTKEKKKHEDDLRCLEAQ